MKRLFLLLSLLLLAAAFAPAQTKSFAVWFGNPAPATCQTGDFWLDSTTGWNLGTSGTPCAWKPMVTSGLPAGFDICNSTTASTAYSCAVPTAIIPFTHLFLNIDTDCATTCTLNVGSLGAKPIKRPDGVTDPTGALTKATPRWVWWNSALNVWVMM